jgi:hypothetical protein
MEEESEVNIVLEKATPKIPKVPIESLLPRGKKAHLEELKKEMEVQEDQKSSLVYWLKVVFFGSVSLLAVRYIYFYISKFNKNVISSVEIPREVVDSIRKMASK